jgi:VanZ family protein
MLRWAFVGLSALGSCLIILANVRYPQNHIAGLLLILIGALMLLVAIDENAKDGFVGVLYGPLVGFGYVNSLRYDAPPEAAWQLLGFAAVLVVLGVLMARKNLSLDSPLTLFGLVLLPMLLAYYSSPAGSPGDLAYRLSEWLGVSEDAGEAILIGARKTVHFVFYGLLALIAWLRFSRSPLFWAVTFVLIHAAFDELRQSLYASRTGSIWDVLIDFAGALTFIAIARARVKRGGQEPPLEPDTL